MEILILMLVAHGVADYPLQGDWLSKAKNHKMDLVGETIWPMALGQHAAVHAGAVYLITQSWLLASLEFISHAIIDYSKCDGRIGYNTDQILHVFCKIVWAGLFLYGVK